jgi:hypothetical protein
MNTLSSIQDKNNIHLEVKDDNLESTNNGDLETFTTPEDFVNFLVEQNVVPEDQKKQVIDDLEENDNKAFNKLKCGNDNITIDSLVKIENQHADKSLRDGLLGIRDIYVAAGIEDKYKDKFRTSKTQAKENTPPTQINYGDLQNVVNNLDDSAWGNTDDKEQYIVDNILKKIGLDEIIKNDSTKSNLTESSIADTIIEKAIMDIIAEEIVAAAGNSETLNMQHILQGFKDAGVETYIKNLDYENDKPTNIFSTDEIITEFVFFAGGDQHYARDHEIVDILTSLGVDPYLFGKDSIETLVGEWLGDNDTMTLQQFIRKFTDAKLTEAPKDVQSINEGTFVGDDEAKKIFEIVDELFATVDATEGQADSVLTENETRILLSGLGFDDNQIGALINIMLEFQQEENIDQEYGTVRRKNDGELEVVSIIRTGEDKEGGDLLSKDAIVGGIIDYLVGK